MIILLPTLISRKFGEIMYRQNAALPLLERKSCHIRKVISNGFYLSLLEKSELLEETQVVLEK